MSTNFSYTAELRGRDGPVPREQKNSTCPDACESRSRPRDVQRRAVGLPQVAEMHISATRTSKSTRRTLFVVFFVHGIPDIACIHFSACLSSGVVAFAECLTAALVLRGNFARVLQKIRES